MLDLSKNSYRKPLVLVEGRMVLREGLSGADLRINALRVRL